MGFTDEGVVGLGETYVGASTLSAMRFITPMIVGTDRHSKYNEGHFKVPEGAGLGVEIDREKLKKYARCYEERGEAGEILDSTRPDWVPTLPLW